MKLDELEFTVRAYNCLRRHGISTVEELCNMTVEDVMRVRNINQDTLLKIKKTLKDNNLCLLNDNQ